MNTTNCFILIVWEDEKSKGSWVRSITSFKHFYQLYINFSMNKITYGFNLKAQLFMYDESVLLSFFSWTHKSWEFLCLIFQECNLCVNRESCLLNAVFSIETWRRAKKCNCSLILMNWMKCNIIPFQKL